MINLSNDTNYAAVFVLKTFFKVTKLKLPFNGLEFNIVDIVELWMSQLQHPGQWSCWGKGRQQRRINVGGSPKCETIVET